AAAAIDAAGYILDQLQFQVSLVDSSVEVDEIKISTGEYQNTVAAGNADTQKPVITLLGDNPMSVSFGSDYLEPGATASD